MGISRLMTEVLPLANFYRPQMVSCNYINRPFPFCLKHFYKSITTGISILVAESSCAYQGHKSNRSLIIIMCSRDFQFGTVPNFTQSSVSGTSQCH
jgi:hypothetical protein